MMTVVGWTLVPFALIPLAMAANGEGRVYLWVGLAIAAGAVVALLVGRTKR